MGRFVAAALADIAADPAILIALAPWLPADARSALEATGYFKSVSSSPAAPPAPRASGRMTAAGTDFILLQGGPYALGQMRGELASFGLAASEATVAEFARFLAEHPEWNAAARDSLVAGGLVDDGYLSGFDEANGNEPVRYVSRAAALAYCRWLSDRAPSGYRFTLPSEAQWSYAAAAGLPRSGILLEPGRSGPVPVTALVPDTVGFKGLLGNVWEWCADSFAIQPAAGVIGRESFPSAEGVVRGGSWANQPGIVDLSSRGPMLASTSSAFLGFRVALVHVTD
ncbi:MAG: hypothetical protein E4H20_07395 [Spirochaetales bacterium]|nr:MAG: hypothetical protein E4H20_07395 [Spirochaetales bacterium]